MLPIKAVVQALKFGRIESTKKIIATECRITYTYENKQQKHQFIKGGLFEAYMEAQKVLFPKGTAQ